MGLIQDAIRKWRMKKEDRKDWEDTQRFQERFEEKKLSHDERLLMKFQEQDRQERIKREVERRKKAENEMVWSGKKWNPINAPNMFINNKNLFAGKADLLRNDMSLIKSKKLFMKK